jgi:hypothetical protein
MPRHHRGFENAGGDGHDADAEARQFAGGGQSQAGDGAFGGRIGCLADLAIEGRNGGGIDDHAAFATFVGGALGNRS